MKNERIINRPEITRENEFLASDQRKLMESQTRRMVMNQKIFIKQTKALIENKIMSNFKINAAKCNAICVEDKFSRIGIANKAMGMDGNIKNSKEIKCLENCLGKKNESYAMLIEVIYFL